MTKKQRETIHRDMVAGRNPTECQILRALGDKALTPGQIGRKLRPRASANFVTQQLWRLEDRGCVGWRQSGCGTRWWATEKGERWLAS